MRRRSISFFIIFLLMFTPLWADIQGNTKDASLAREEFRRGILAYNRMAFNEAILAFEKALSYLNDEAVIFEWLGNAYYRSGYDDTALRQWTYAMDRYEPSESHYALLSSRVEMVKNRRVFSPAIDSLERYVEAAHFPGLNGESKVFLNPSSVYPLEDGSFWLVAHGSNELLRMDVNGLVRQRVVGPINGFDRPWDMVQSSEGNLYVSEQRGSRISVLDKSGKWQAYIGKKGRGEGELIGPQFLCLDGQENLLVVDYGNMRVQKFSKEGIPLFSFGKKTGAFPGFRSPTGIAWVQDRIWVADAAHRLLFSFDNSGNYLGAAAEDFMQAPEGLRVDSEDRLLIADGSRILVFDPANKKIWEQGSLGRAGGRIVSADSDRNGSVLLANYNLNEVNVLCRMDDLSAGMQVRVQSIDATRFPEITFEVKVEDRLRRPLLGLRELNFLIQEDAYPVENLKFLGSADLESRTELHLVIERSPAMINEDSKIVRSVENLLHAGAEVVSVVHAGEKPILEKPSNRNELAHALKGLSKSANWSFDLAMRLAGTEAIASSSKRSVVFIGQGHSEDLTFNSYSLQDLATYLANNNIMFNAVMMSQSTQRPELEYLANRTGGKVYWAFRPEGLAEIVQRLRSMPVGSYSFSYTSRLDSDWGRRFLPLSVEVYLLNRSGRDSTNYFAPLM